jgi:hypothetical protein
MGQRYIRRLDAVRPADSKHPWDSVSRSNKGHMARDKNTYAKRQRETLKRQKAEAKQERRRKRKEGADIMEARPEPGGVSGPLS